MHPKFQEFTDRLHPSFEKLVTMSPVSSRQLPKAGGIYLYSEGANHLYVGRTKNLRGRHGMHSRASSCSNKASFAFLLAREQRGEKLAGYHRDGKNRAELMLDPDFSRAFVEAKDRVRQMDHRYVEEDDEVCQALLEVYCAVVLTTPYNSFATH